MNNLSNKAKQISAKALGFASKHRFVLVIAILGAAVSFSLYKTQSLQDVSRDETKYTDGVLQIKYKKIEEETLKEFKSADLDNNVEVNSNFNPDRDNPFNE